MNKTSKLVTDLAKHMGMEMVCQDGHAQMTVLHVGRVRYERRQCQTHIG